MRTSQLSPAVDAPDCSAAGEAPPPSRPPVAPAVLAELRGVQRTLDHGGIVALKVAEGTERADQLDVLAAQLVQAAIVCASAAGAERTAARLAEGVHTVGGHDGR